MTRQQRRVPIMEVAVAQIDGMDWPTIQQRKYGDVARETLLPLKWPTRSPRRRWTFAQPNRAGVA